MCTRACLPLFLLIPYARPAPQAKPELALIDRARQRMARNLASLPNYTCLETIERSVSRPAKHKLLFRDRIHVEVAFIEGKEMFSWPGSSTFEPDLFEQIPQAGASGAGGFGGWTRTLFGPSAPGLTYAGECTVEGRRGWHYEFRVPRESSTYEVRSVDRQAMAPYSGSICIDPGSLDIILLEIRADQTPAPVKAISESIHYARARVGSGDFLLPQDQELAVTDLEGRENRNLTHFSGCRAFSSESSISFETDHPSKPSRPAKAEALQIPGGISLDVKLETAITFEESAVGDPITARLNRAIKASGVSVPKGAIASGRIRGLERYFEPQRYFVVSLELSSLAFGGKRALLRARLVGPRLETERRSDSSGMSMETHVTTLDSTRPESTGFDIDDSAPRFGVFRVRGGKLHLSRGLRMIWETQSLKALAAPGSAQLTPAQ